MHWRRYMSLSKQDDHGPWAPVQPYFMNRVRILKFGSLIIFNYFYLFLEWKYSFPPLNLLPSYCSHF
jgi:hypothetical protein